MATDRPSMWYYPWFDPTIYRSGLGPVPKGISRHSTHREVVMRLKEVGYKTLAAEPESKILDLVNVILQSIAQTPFCVILSNSMELKQTIMDIVLQTWAFTKQDRVRAIDQAELFKLAKLDISSTFYDEDVQEATRPIRINTGMLAWKGITVLNKAFSRYSAFAEGILDNYLRNNKRILFLGNRLGARHSNDTEVEAALHDILRENFGPSFVSSFDYHSELFILDVASKKQPLTRWEG